MYIDNIPASQASLPENAEISLLPCLFNRKDRVWPRIHERSYRRGIASLDSALRGEEGLPSTSRGRPQPASWREWS